MGGLPKNTTDHSVLLETQRGQVPPPQQCARALLCPLHRLTWCTLVQLHQVSGVRALYSSYSLRLLVFIIEYTALPISGNGHLHFHIGNGLIYSN